MPRRCVNSTNNFCYICGEVTFATSKRPMTAIIQKAYFLYFGCRVGDQDKPWAPHVCCNTCSANLWSWLHGKGRAMPFAVPMVWREPTNHVTDCYFCMVPRLHGLNKKTKINYPNIPSAIRPVPHSEELPIPETPTFTMESDVDEPETPTFMKEVSTQPSSSTDPEFVSNVSEEPHKITQEELNDLIRDLELPKNKAELLASRLKQWNHLAGDVKVTYFRSRQQFFLQFYSEEGDLTFCNDVNGVMAALGITHNRDEWRLFIDSSKVSLKAVLLHNGNMLPSVPLAYATHTKETYTVMENLLRLIQYKTHQWHVCCDFKVIAILMGLQQGYTKFCCFLCEWDSRDRKHHYKKKEWPRRSSLTPGQKNVVYQPLVNVDNVILPPLHIKLGLMKQFVKALDKNGDAFTYLCQRFPRITTGKIKEGIFIGPQIRQLQKDEEFESRLQESEREAWKAFKNVSTGLLGNVRAENFHQLVDELITAYQKMGCRMSLKLHILYSHLDVFPVNCGALSDEHGERFHQDIAVIEKRYKGKWSPAMLADYSWAIKRDAPGTEYKRQAKRRRT